MFVTKRHDVTKRHPLPFGISSFDIHRLTFLPTKWKKKMEEGEENKISRTSLNEYEEEWRSFLILQNT